MTLRLSETDAFITIVVLCFMRLPLVGEVIVMVSGMGVGVSVGVKVGVGVKVALGVTVGVIPEVLSKEQYPSGCLV